MIEFTDTDPLYSSQKDIGSPEQDVATFTPAPEVSYTVNKPPVEQKPFFKDSVTEPIVTAPLSQDTAVIQSQITKIPTKLAQILEQDQPVFKKEVVPFVPDFSMPEVVPQEPAINADIKSVIPEKVKSNTIKRKKKVGILDSMTNFVYKLIYKK